MRLVKLTLHGFKSFADPTEFHFDEQVTGIVGAGLVALLLLFLNTLLSDLPQTALAAVVIVAALSLADVAVLGRYLRVRKSAFALSLVASSCSAVWVSGPTPSPVAPP